MTMTEKHQEIRPLLAMYALGGLDAEERSVVDGHLVDCKDCQRELARFSEVADGLLQAVPPQAAPGTIRRHLESALSRRVKPAPVRRSPALAWTRLALGLGLAALVGVNLLLAANVSQLSQQVRDLASQVDRNQTGLALMTYPTVQVAELQGQTVFGTLVYDPARRVAVVYAWGLPHLPPGQAYQAWFRQDSQDRVNGGLFQAQDPDSFTVVVVEAPEALASYTGLGVTIEPATGSPGPSSPTVFSADFH
ncbi:MAG TPA: anti-sigma factor [Anaerolineales bacterium]|jgi:anti-sigma-K factor RskA